MHVRPVTEFFALTPVAAFCHEILADKKKPDAVFGTRVCDYLDSVTALA